MSSGIQARFKIPTTAAFPLHRPCPKCCHDPYLGCDGARARQLFSKSNNRRNAEVEQAERLTSVCVRCAMSTAARGLLSVRRAEFGRQLDWLDPWHSEAPPGD